MQNKVAIVTGGGSGQKPSFIGYLGRGMLEAVAVGEVFTSLPVPTILECIKAADSGTGPMLLLGNQAGEVMNFDMAVEVAHDAGFEVELKTMLDAVHPAAEAARAGAVATKSIVAKIGRASRLGERTLGHQDAGATLVAIILCVAAEALA